MSSQIDSLSNEFNMLISQYQDTYQKYIDVINSDNTNFKTFNNSAFYGQQQINTLNNTNLKKIKLKSDHFIAFREIIFFIERLTFGDIF